MNHDTNTETVSGRPTMRPAVDIFENSSGLLLVADLPGVTQDSLAIELEDGTLTLHGKRTDRVAGAADRGADDSSRNGDGLKILAGQAETIDFKRSFQVPDTIDVEAIDATLVDGVLTLRLPRVARAQPRRIAVKAG